MGVLDAENQILNQAFERLRSQKLNYGETNGINKEKHNGKETCQNGTETLL